MTTTMMPGSTMCSAPLCDDHAHMVNTTQCGQCECDPGWAGPGSLCAPDTDNDGWPDTSLNCPDPECTRDNCPAVPNSGQQENITLLPAHYCPLQLKLKAH